MKRIIVRKSLFVFLLAVLLPAVAGAPLFAGGSRESRNGAILIGNGAVREEVRSVGAFSSVRMSGSGNLFLSRGAETRVVVRVDENLLPYLETRVVDGELRVGFRSGISTQRYERLEVEVTLPELRKVTFSGSGTILGRTPFEGDAMSLLIDGAASLEMEVRVETMKATLAGTGSFDLSGSARDLQVEIAGSGEFRAGRLAAETAVVHISGSSRVETNAARALEVKIAGSGVVEYRGDPSVQVTVSGSGSVRKVP